jgi:hypothetical protein
MGLRRWWDKMRGREDEEAIQHELDREAETPEERFTEDEGARGVTLDTQSSRLAGETIKEAEQLGDAE